MSNSNAGATASDVSPSAGPHQGMAPAPRRWSAGRIIVLILSGLMLFGALGIGISAGALALADKGLRDGQGFFMSGLQPLSSAGHAISSERVELHLDGPTRFVPDRVIGT